MSGKIAQAIEKGISGINTIGGSKMAEPTGLMGEVGGRLISPEEGGGQPQPETSTPVGSVGSYAVPHPNGASTTWDGPTWPPTLADTDRQTFESWVKSWSPRLYAKAPAKVDPPKPSKSTMEIF